MKHEFDILRRNSPDAIILNYEKEIEAILYKHNKERHSGSSAEYYAAIIASSIKNLCLFRPISPITDDPNDWEFIGTEPTLYHVYQHKRLSPLFKDNNNNVQYINAVVFDDITTDIQFTGSIKLATGEWIQSTQKIKGFPFTPTTIFLKIRKLLDDTDGTTIYELVSPSQLNEISQNYDFKMIAEK